MRRLLGIACGALLAAGAVQAESVTVDIHRVSDQGVEEQIGTVTLQNSDWGLVVAPDIRDLPPGTRGFHVHQFPDCGAIDPEGGDNGAAKAAGGHLDPLNTNVHAGPAADVGHAGDLPVLVVNEEGVAKVPVISPRLRLEAVRGHSLVIHEGGDNYADEPEPLGGGGARIACGVIAAAD
ncbi:superoxide dismutase family protein [Ectothiorhodospiraceae bacterium 2226]|nr:superoxide dismutase family protein [Ectothiorhodospiraceae bacterium 2226]